MEETQELLVRIISKTDGKISVQEFRKESLTNPQYPMSTARSAQ